MFADPLALRLEPATSRPRWHSVWPIARPLLTSSTRRRRRRFPQEAGHNPSVAFGAPPRERVKGPRAALLPTAWFTCEHTGLTMPRESIGTCGSAQWPDRDSIDAELESGVALPASALWTGAA